MTYTFRLLSTFLKYGPFFFLVLNVRSETVQILCKTNTAIQNTEYKTERTPESTLPIECKSIIIYKNATISWTLQAVAYLVQDSWKYYITKYVQTQNIQV
jgi:hypothetical protein